MAKKLLRPLISAAKKLRLGALARGVAALLPARIRVHVESTAYDLRRRSGNLTGHVASRELEERFRQALELLHERSNGAGTGDYLEFGVYGGATMACFDRARRAAGFNGMRLIGFDSFEGLPENAADEAPDRFRAGMFSCTAEEARATLRGAGVDLTNVRLVEGWFDDTLTDEVRRAQRIEHAGVIMLDCDLYSSAKAALEFCAPAINGAAAVVCDDWVHGGEDGEKRAFGEFVAEHDLVVEPLGHYRAGGHPDGGRVFLVSRR